MKFSTHYPSILVACDEDGYIILLDSNSEIKKNNINNQRQFNNGTKINPLIIKKIHNNAALCVNFFQNDKKLLTSSSDSTAKIINLSSDHFCFNEMELCGHKKRVKNVCPNIFDENIIATSGSEGIIFLWDIRMNNNRFCKFGKCQNYDKNIPHIHPVGAFINYVNNISFRKDLKNDFLLKEMANSFTGIDFLNKNILVSIETNSDALKFWDMRNKLNTELDFIFGMEEKRISKKEFQKNILNKNYFALIDQYTNIYIKYANLKERNSLSSKYNSNDNLLFKNQYAFNNKNGIRKENVVNDDLFLNDNNIQIKDIEMNINENNYFTSEENILKNKIKEINRVRKKTLTSLNINRAQRKILVHSINGIEYVYNLLFKDIEAPIEIKGTSTNFSVKSILSPSGRYILSFNENSVPVIIDLKNKLNDNNYYKGNLIGCPHEPPVIGTVAWGKNNSCPLATSCDCGSISFYDIIHE